MALLAGTTESTSIAPALVLLLATASTSMLAPSDVSCILPTIRSLTKAAADLRTDEVSSIYYMCTDPSLDNTVNSDSLNCSLSIDANRKVLIAPIQNRFTAKLCLGRSSLSAGFLRRAQLSCETILIRNIHRRLGGESNREIVSCRACARSLYP